MSSATPSLGSPFPVIELDEIDSTNSEALRRATAGERGPLWLLARRQTAGRGRSGRTWQSLDGNLAATLLLAPGCRPDRLHQLSLLAGVAVYDAVEPLYRAARAPGAGAPRLKWPNDIMAGQAKLGGILIESTSIGGAVVAAVGIGLDVAGAPRIEGRATAALGDWGIETTPRSVLSSIEAHLRRWLSSWQAGDRFDLVRTAWLERAGRVGEPIEIDCGNERVSGAFAGIDETGALLVCNVLSKPGDTRRFTFGDVTLLPRQTED